MPVRDMADVITLLLVDVPIHAEMNPALFTSYEPLPHVQTPRVASVKPADVRVPGASGPEEKCNRPHRQRRRAESIHDQSPHREHSSILHPLRGSRPLVLHGLASRIRGSVRPIHAGRTRTRGTGPRAVGDSGGPPQQDRQTSDGEVSGGSMPAPNSVRELPFVGLERRGLSQCSRSCRIPVFARYCPCRPPWGRRTPGRGSGSERSALPTSRRATPLPSSWLRLRTQSAINPTQRRQRRRTAVIDEAP